jgi:hypothetical protein
VGSEKKMIQTGMGKKLRPRRSWKDIIKAMLAFCSLHNIKTQWSLFVSPALTSGNWPIQKLAVTGLYSIN